MSVDLGKYAVTVWAAYGSTIVLLILLVGFYLLQNSRSKADLEDAERSQDA